MFKNKKLLESSYYLVASVALIICFGFGVSYLLEVGVDGIFNGFFDKYS